MDSETVWRALASPHRRKLLDMMREGPRTTGQLARELPDLSRFAVMQHLGVLEQAGLVLYRKEGRKRFNYVNPIPLRQMYERWVNRYSSSAAETALHLKRYAETTKKEATKVDQNEFRLVKIEMEMRINAPRERVFAALTTEYDNWWPHRYKADSTCFVEPRVGGAVGEAFKNGGGAHHGRIVYYDPPHKIAWSGMGSMSRGSVGYTTDTLEEDGQGTIYQRVMTLWGAVPPEVEQMFREGSRQLMEQALVGYIERGERYVPAEEDGER